MPASRTYDIVLLGATGFTGGLTAEYLATHAPPHCRWAIAGGSLQKLTAVKRHLASLDGAVSQPAVEQVDATDPQGLRKLAEATGVLITTVGPYILHGDPVVAACAAAGTDYLDLTGEPEFADQTYLRHHATARASGARLIQAAGFDSTPHDLGALFCVEQLPEGVPLTVEGFTRVAGGDPGYGETAKMLSEAALCLAFDENLPPSSGQTTTAAAMGDALIERLKRAGITFEVVSSARAASEKVSA